MQAMVITVHLSAAPCTVHRVLVILFYQIKMRMIRGVSLLPWYPASRNFYFYSKRVYYGFIAMKRSLTDSVSTIEQVRSHVTMPKGLHRRVSVRASLLNGVCQLSSTVTSM